jgi:hypothetical protein
LSTITATWLGYDHYITEDKLKKENLSNTTNNFEATTKYMLTETHSRVSNHNDSILLFYIIGKNLETSSIALEESKQFLGDNYKYLNSDVKDTNSLLLFVSKRLIKKDFKSYSEIFISLSSANLSLNNYEENYKLYLQNNPKLIQAELDIFITAENNCFLSTQNNQNNPQSNQNNQNKNIQNCAKNISESILEQSNYSYINLSATIFNVCTNRNVLVEERNNITSTIQSRRALASENVLSLADAENVKYDIQKLTTYKSQFNGRLDLTANITIEILNNYISALQASNVLIEHPIDLNSRINETLIPYFLPMAFTLREMNSCETKNALKVNYTNINYEIIQEINTTNAKQIQNISLPPLLPRACFKDVCKPYLYDANKNYPLVLVHGHGFYSKNSPIIPSQVYNGLQNSLLNDELYIPAGILKEDTDIISNSLGFIDAPFVYKASYYPEDIRDDESIELFADRLNTIVRKAKEETGKDKVTIICHSMGGLVTRTYLKKYGTNDVNFVIIGGTPNYGVTSETVTFCKLFGRDKECDEMFEQSQFISDLENEPKYNIPIYTIRGEGCSTFGDDGDGIVQSKSVPLSYSINYAFNGTCSFTGDFHTNLFNPEYSPAIYDKVKELLVENK